MSFSNTHFAPDTVRLGGFTRNSPTLICVSALAGIPAWVRENCGDRTLHQANRAAMLDIETIEDQDCFIPHTTMTTFVESVARTAGIPNLGVVLAPHLNFQGYGVWAGYVLGASNLDGALRRAERSISYHSYGDSLALSITGDIVRFGYSSAARGLPGYHHDAAGTIGVMISLCRHYLGEDWRPDRIELDIPPPNDDGAYEDTFQVPVEFDQPSLALVFNASLLKTSRRDGESATVVTIEDVARARLEPASRDTLLGAVSAQIRCQVLSGRVSINSAAQALDVSVRSLQRELNIAGKSFRNIVNRVRVDRAVELLGDDSLLAEEISRQLGYSSSAHFARAFRRETGLSPTEFRARHLAFKPTAQHQPGRHASSFSHL